MSQSLQVTSLSMRLPYTCHYCGMTSMRRGNVSAHIQRKHPKEYNPFPDMKQKQSDCNFSHPKMPRPSNLSSAQYESPNFNSPKYESPNFSSPPYDFPDPAQFFENTRKFQDVLREINQWNKFELACLLTAIYKHHNFSH
jgi:hypothetical protein